MHYVPRPTTHLLSPGLYSAMVDLAGRLGTHDVRRAFADEGFPQWVVPPSARPLTQEELPQSKLKAFAVVAATSLAATAMTARDLARDYLQWAEEHSATHGLLLVAVIEELLWLDQQHADDEDYDPEPAARLIRRLEKDGYRLDDRGRLHPPATLFLDSALDQVQDPQVIRQLLHRIRKSLPDDRKLSR